MQDHSKLDNPELVSQFVQYADELAGFHHSHNIPFRSYETPDLPHFSKLPVEIKRLVLSVLGENIELHREMATFGESLLDSPKLLWRSLKRIGWHPMSDIFDKIEDGDVVELYDSSQIQLFRNLYFFRYISMTLEEIVSHPLGVMMDIGEKTIEFYNSVTARVVANKIRETEACSLPPYIVSEKSGDKFRVTVTPKWLSPVMSKGIVRGIIVIHSSELLD